MASLYSTFGVIGGEKSDLGLANGVRGFLINYLLGSLFLFL